MKEVLTSSSGANVIGIMGGTFNPFHLGHLELARQAHFQFNLPKVLVMPSKDPSTYKDDSVLVSAMHRCHMVEIAIAPFPYLSLSRMEMEREGHTYTADTLSLLKDSYDEIYFIIGADSFFSIDHWYHPEYVLQHCHLIVANRDSYSEDQMHKRAQYLSESYGAKVDFLQLGELPYSSTEIRERIKNHLPVDAMVGKDVAEYINKNQLYI